MSRVSQILASKLVKIMAVILLLCAVGVRISAQVMGVEKYHQVILNEITRLTDGKEVKIQGAFSLHTVPILNTAKIIIPKITIRDVNNANGRVFFQAKNVVLSMSLMNFFLGRPRFDSLDIQDAHINLEIIEDDNKNLHKNWSFIYNSTNKTNELLDLNSIIIHDSKISYQDNNIKLKFEKVNLETEFNKKNHVAIKGSLFFDDLMLNVETQIANYQLDKPQDLKMQIINDEFEANFQGQLINKLDKFQINSEMKILLKKPSFIADSIVKIAPFLYSMKQNQLKDPLNVLGNISIVDSSMQATNLKISSPSIQGTGDIKMLLKGDQDMIINLNFDYLDITNFISFDADNLIQAFSDRVLTSNADTAVEKNTDMQNSYLNFSLIDNENTAIQLNIKKFSMQNSELQNLGFDFSTKKGLVNKGNLSFDIGDKDYTTTINLKGLTFQKVDDVYLLLGELVNEGANINETLKLLHLQEFVDINSEKLNYSLVSKIIFSPKEISLFDIQGKIGENGGFVGSIASTHDEISHYNFDLKFNDLKLANFSMPLFKERLNTLLTKSGDEDYLSYFRWFRTLSSSYRLKFEFIDTEIQHEKIDSLTATCKLLPGTMSFKIGIKSDFADGDYQVDITATKLKPTLDITVNSNHLDFNRLGPLMFGFMNHDNDVNQTGSVDQELWSSQKFNIFRIYKYLATLDLSVIDLQIGKQKLADFRFISHTSNDILYIDNWYFKLYGGELQAQGNISFFDQLLYQFSFTTSGMESKMILAENFPALSGIDGQIAATGSIITQGDSPQSLIANLNFSSSIAASGMTLKGVDSDVIVDIALKRKAVDTDKVLSNIDELLKTGSTDISALNGNIKASNGVFVTNNINFKTRFSNAVFAMSLDLNNLTFSSNTQFAFASYLSKDAISYNLIKSGSLKQDLKRIVDSDNLLKYVKGQYGIVTEEDRLQAKKLLEEQRKALAVDPESKDYLYYKLKEQSDALDKKATDAALNNKASVSNKIISPQPEIKASDNKDYLYLKLQAKEQNKDTTKQTKDSFTQDKNLAGNNDQPIKASIPQVSSSK